VPGPTPTPTPTPTPDPVTPPAPPVPPSQFPTVRLVPVHRTRDREWNISFHGSGIVGEYNNESRHDARLVPLGQPKKDLIEGDWETLQAPADGVHCAAEKGSRGAPIIMGSRVVIGRTPHHKISLCTAVLGKATVTFSADQKKTAHSDYEDTATGELVGNLNKSGAVIAAVQHEGGLLCVLQGGEKPTVVHTDGREIPLNAWSLARSDSGRIIAGANDGHVHELLGQAWYRLTRTGLGGRVMAVCFDGGYIWATTDKGAVWVILDDDGRNKVVQEGAGHYRAGSWFGPRFGLHAGRLHVSRKASDGGSWRCAVERVELL
jgi:hypothetical protein